MYRDNKKAMAQAGVDHKANYKIIKSYAQVIINHIPQSSALVQVYRVHNQQPTTHFDRFVLSFSTLRNEFKECRPLIGVERCHLKGLCKGVLLSTVTLDGNNSVQPFAICFAEIRAKPYVHGFLSLKGIFE